MHLTLMISFIFLFQIHSITARSVPKEQLERLKDSSGDTSGAIDSSANDTKPVQPGRSTALTTGQQIKQTPNMPKQVYHFSEDNKSKKQSTHIPKQSVQISSSVKPVGQANAKSQNAVKINLATGNTNKPLSDNESSNLHLKQPIKNSVKPTEKVAQPLEINVKTGADIDTPEERKSPKIKTGAISAMSKFWENMNTGVKEKAPEILEKE